MSAHQTTNDEPGFEFLRLAHPDGFNESALYLPAAIAQEMRDAKKALEEARAKVRAEQATSPPTPRPSRPARELIDVDVERAKVQVPELGQWSGDRYPTYDAYAPVEMLARSRGYADKRDQERVEAIYKQLQAQGSCLREVGWPSDIEIDFESLQERLPHFAVVLEFAQQRLHVAEANGLPPRIPPILLTGAAGVGKTHFCRALAEVLRTTVRHQPFDNAQTTSTLLGSERHWGNTHYGLLFELLALGRHANPVVILDELDKVRVPSSYMDPLAPLHTILEPCTAGALRDQSLDFVLDASLVTFIATANDTSRIPETLVSRFRVFEIKQPTGAQALAFAQEVLRSVLQRHALQLPVNSRKLAAAVAHLSAREITQATEDALARMFAVGRRELRPVDFTPPMEAGAPWVH